MLTSLSPTGNTKQDISNIIDVINDLNDNPSIQNVISIASYGQVEVTITEADYGLDIDVLIPHGLSYPPAFFIQLIASDSTNFQLPFVSESYSYNIGPQSQGTYPYEVLNALVDDTYLRVSLFNIANPASAITVGTYVFSYYLFSRPLQAL